MTTHDRLERDAVLTAAIYARRLRPGRTALEILAGTCLGLLPVVAITLLGIRW